MSRGWSVAIATAVSAFFAYPGAAWGARVVVLAAGGHAVVRDDPFLTLPAQTPAPAPPSVARAVPSRASRARRRTVVKELVRLRKAGAISASAYRHDLERWSAALKTRRRLRGTRAGELGGVIANIRQIAASGLLTASRLPALFKTLDGNRRWWTTGPMITPGDRVEFAGSELVWEYYQGQGIELQELGSFGKADGLYTAGRSHYAQMRRLLAELVPLAARRAGGLTWEYYFNFDGGVPPWTSAMSQGTALEALTRAHAAFHDPSYFETARRALPVLAAKPARGVAVATRRGTRYLLYSFAPGAKVLNGFLQTLIGLYDYAHASGDQRAARLFAMGDAEARFEVPSYDTGSWSLYQPGVTDSVDYHVLVTGFLHELCSRTRARIYCRTAARFDTYLKNPPPGV